MASEDAVEYNAPNRTKLMADTASNEKTMTKRVTLDAMIPREDFAVMADEAVLNPFGDFPIWHLDSQKSPVFKLLRKPDFQRETNHWSAEQITTFIASFLDNEVIPGLILWRSASYIFVLDGGHRLSALRAWMEDDYGDNSVSLGFYKGSIPKEQVAIAKNARKLIESRVGRYSQLISLVDANAGVDPVKLRRARMLVTRTLQLQWVQGDASVAETSFFKINSQGTPLDEIETLLIKNRRSPIAIGARAILRSGKGHKYWSAFSSQDIKERIESLAEEFYQLLFEPEVQTPLKTLEVSMGGYVSPVDALALLIEFLTISGTRDSKIKTIADFGKDSDGTSTVGALSKSLEVLRRITGTSAGSLGLFPAVYFYNERGKYSRFLFLGVIALVTEKLRENNQTFFKRFTTARRAVEDFLVDNKSLLTNSLQNMAKGQRVPRMKSLFELLIERANANEELTPEAAIEHMGLQGRVYDLTERATAKSFSDDTKTTIFFRSSLNSALRCDICGARLSPTTAVSYDHILRVAEGGIGDAGNGQLVHPFCNTGMKG